MYRPRLSVEITDEQALDLRRCLAYKTRKPLFSAIIDDIIRLYDEHGEMFLAAVIDKKITLEEYLGRRKDKE